MNVPFKYPPQAVLLDASLINDSDRTRTDYGDLDELAESIETNGLLHPPVVDLNNRLIAGGRRTRAIRDVLKSPVVPVLVLEVLDDAHLAILEAEENIRRKQPTWQERVLGVAKVHEALKRGSILDGRRWTIVETGEMLGVSFSNVNNALTLARFIRAGDKKVASAATITDALKVLVDYELAKVQKAQADFLLAKGAEVKTTAQPQALEVLKQQQSLTKTTAKDDDAFFSAAPGSVGVGVVGPIVDLDEMPGMATAAPAGPVPEVALSRMLFKGRMESLCYDVLGASSVDHIFTDWPYAIDMGNLAQGNRSIDGIDSVEAEHDVTENLADMPTWLKAMYHVLRDNGFCVVWYDISTHERMQQWAIEAGFKTQRWPLIWHKTHSCINQAAGKNFTKNFEVAMVLRKGNSTLLSAQASSVWTGTNDDLKIQLGHPFVKPLRLWQWLFNAIAMRGQTVLDPFAGVGSSTIAALDFGLVPLAMECNEGHYDRLVVNVAQHYRKINPLTKFI